MAAKRTVTIAELINEIDYELRNTAEAQYDDETELFEYYCMAEEFLYTLLVNDKSPLISLTKGTVTLVTDDYSYNLSTDGTANYSDIWVPFKCWIAGYDPIELSDISCYNDHLDSDGSVISGTPSEYYIEGSNPDLVILDAPDSSYNGDTLNLWYYPNWTKPAADTAYVAFRNQFNSQIREMIKTKAKNRNAKPADVEVAWMEIYQDRAFMLANQGRATGIQLQVKRS